MADNTEGRTARRIRRAAALAGAAAVVLLMVGWPPAAVPTGASQAAPEPDGQALYNQNCAGCHAVGGEGTPRGPALVGVGPASLDFYLSTGRMPPNKAASAEHSNPAFTPDEITAIVGYAATFAGATPAVPQVRAQNSQQGLRLYLAYCAACHSATGVGAALTGGRWASSLNQATPTQIGEAIRVGPGAMPAFPADVLSDDDIDSIAAYIDVLQGNRGNLDKGGLSLGRIGPVTEGAVAWLVGLGALLLIVRALGRRAE